MEKLSIYEYKDYKKYILQWLDRTPQHGRGQRKHLAEALGCQTPFITHVLGGDYHFSLEQAEAAARWMGLSESEIEFFILLVMKQRAGTKNLENLLNKQISRRREAETVLKKRLEIPEEMQLDDQLTYYSSWHYSALHMACLIPALQSVEALQKHFRLPLTQILSTLEFLTEHKLIEKTRTGYRVLKPVLHLGLDSPLMTQHHSHWRIRAIDAIQRKQGTDLFYSGVASLSQEDFEWLREKLSQFLAESIGRIRDSKDEKLICFNFDCFEV